MNISTLVLNFHDTKTNSRNDYLMKLHDENIIDIKYWIGESEHANIKRYRSFVNDDDFNPKNLLNLDPVFEDYFYDKYFNKYIDCASRKYIDIKKYNEFYFNIFQYSYYDTKDEFRFLCKFFYTLIKKKDIKLVLFFSIPHHSWDLIVYYLAIEMNIKTAMYNFFPYLNEYCNHILIEKIEDLGLYETAIENKDIQLNQDLTQDILDLITNQKYYYGMYKGNNNIFNETANLFLNKTLFHIKNRFLARINSLKRFLIEIKMNNIAPSLQLFKNAILGRFAYQESQITVDANRSYFTNYNKYVSEIDNNDKFILFALHYQPELTTSPVAGIYSDQMLAIERLSAILPDGYKIYVKENPLQDYHMRGNLFFKRLSLLSNVKLIKIEYNTLDLLKKSVFVSTISGTIGFEAICRGKNVLIFNKNAWYSQFRGIHIYDNSMKNIDILLKENRNNIKENLIFDISKLHKKINNCYHNIINPNFTDTKENQNILYLELKNYINHLFNK